ncbi:MAG: energy-coupling factor ABC transporter permease [Betaproteobacteria bacterium]|nr:energy-coupling factor ABC transporter permease [Betaproteobacteria bacterium]
MNLVSAHLPLPWLWTFWLSALALGGVMLRRASWAMLRDARNLNVFLAATVVVLALWQIKTGIKPGLALHLLGATGLTLMFRPLFALLAMALITTLLGLWQGDYSAIAGNFLLMGALPVGVSWGVYRLVDRRLPNHFFVYIFLNAFFGAALATLAVGLCATGIAALAGLYRLDYLLENYLPFYLLLAWAEAFATGMLVTLMVVWKPEWVSTFDDRRYLLNK